MRELIDQLGELLRGPTPLATLRAALWVLSGIAFSRVVGRSVERVLSVSAGVQAAALARRLVAYALFCLGAVMALRELGFDLTALLGAAGIVTVAMGFAAQTSASNLISGLFLMGERSFGIGDVVRVGTTTGEVIGIDMLSVKLRTFDNVLVRLPNEMLVKSEFTTLSRFPIRRVDVQLLAAFDEDLERLRALLLQTAQRMPLCLEEPKPVFIVTGFGEYAIQVQFSVWTVRENFLEMRTGLLMAIQSALREAGIRLPYPHRTLVHAGELAPQPPAAIRALESE